MAKILGIKKLDLRTRFQIVKVEMDFPDPCCDIDYCFIESMVNYKHSGYTDFRFISGVHSPADTYCTYWLCSCNPRCGISEKDLQMFKDIFYFLQL